MAVSDKTITIIADEVFATMEAPSEVAPFADRFPGFGLEDAYEVIHEIRRRREMRGEKIVGRKIGFTNAAAWTGYGISGPAWNYLYDTTTLDLPLPRGNFSLGAWPNVRVELEIALGLCKAPEPDMGDEELLDCIEWAALDFEICTSIFPAWRFMAADAAATGLHAALLLGARHPIGEARKRSAGELASFEASLSEVGGACSMGGGAQVLGSPWRASGEPLHAESS